MQKPVSALPLFTRQNPAPLAPPVPDNATFCGLPAALSLMLSAALRVPLAVGLKLTLIVQLAPAANELPQLVVREKSPALVPVIAMLLMVKLVVPTFVSTVFAELVLPMATVPKFKLLGESFAVVPIPL